MVRWISGQVSRRLVIRVSLLIPKDLKIIWEATNLGEGENIVSLGEDWQVFAMYSHLPEKIEAGGVLGHNKMSMYGGDAWSVCAASGIFTWHSHITGPCMFSLQDWCSFIISQSLWTLLITPDSYIVYYKKNHQLVEETKRFILGYSLEKPSSQLMIRRFRKLIAKKNEQPNLGAQNNARAQVLGICCKGPYKV